VARGNQTAQTASQDALNLSNTEGENANSVISSLAPQLESSVAAPPGISPADMAKIKTSNLQGAGGATAGAVGAGELAAERTHNRGTAPAAIGESVRTAGQDLGKENLDTEIANQKLKEQQRTAALTGLGSLENTETGGANNALGEVASNVGANTGAQNASWDWATDLFNPLVKAASGQP
jgi:hypothetical protein